MPNKYIRKTNRASWSAEDLKNAGLAVLEKRMSIRAASKQYHIPEKTLRNRVKNNNFDKGALGPSSKLGCEAEKKLVDHILDLQAFGICPKGKDVQEMAFNMAQHHNIRTNFNSKNGKAGKVWLASFMRRNPQLAISKAKGTSQARIEGMNRKGASDYLELLSQIMDDNDLQNKPGNIWNVDETELQLNNELGEVSQGVPVEVNTNADESSLSLPGPSNLKRKSICSSSILPLLSEKDKMLKINDVYSLVVETSSNKREEIDSQVAKYFYATNTSFGSVENPHFKKLMEILHPGYLPPSKSDLDSNLLDKVYQSEMENCRNNLKNQTVCMSLDGWSNVHNQTVICICVTTMEGNVHLVDTIDTSITPHTDENLTDLAVTSIKKVQKKFNCHIRSFVTDNAADMEYMRKSLEAKDRDCIDVVCYGCSAHILNLLAKDLELPGVAEHVIQIIKYFRNNQFARAKFNDKNVGKSVDLCLPLQVHWNTICDSLESYIKNWPILVQIVDENRDAIDDSIISKIMNMSIKKNAEDILLRLKPISIALDRIQKNGCSIAEAVDIWKKLETELKENNVLDHCKISIVNKSFKSRYNQALKPVHFLAYLLSPTFQPENLSTEEKSRAIEFVNEYFKDTSLMAILMKFVVRSEPFNGPLFEEKVVKEVNSLDWWKSFSALKDCISSKELFVIEQLMTAKATSARVGFVHNKIRNQLGVEKAAKLAFLFKSLNQE